MLAQDFIAAIEKSPPPSVVFFGPYKAPRARDATFEPLLMERAVEALINKYVDPSLRDLSYSAFYAEETHPGSIVGEAQTLPFLAERRVIVVRNAEYYFVESHAAEMSAYVSNPCDSCILILIAAQADKRVKFFKALEKSAVIVECGELSDGEMKAWIQGEMKARHKSITSSAIDELMRRAGSKLSDVSNALNLVCSFVGETQPTIQEADITAACADVAEEEIWALTDAIAYSKTDKALQALQKLTDLGKRPEEILGTINWLLKTAYTVLTGYPTSPPLNKFVADKVRPLANKLGLKKLKDAFALITDTQFKTRTSGVDIELAIELLVIKLAAPFKRPAA